MAEEDKPRTNLHKNFRKALIGAAQKTFLAGVLIASILGYSYSITPKRLEGRIVQVNTTNYQNSNTCSLLLNTGDRDKYGREIFKEVMYSSHPDSLFSQKTRNQVNYVTNNFGIGDDIIIHKTYWEYSLPELIKKPDNLQ